MGGGDTTWEGEGSRHPSRERQWDRSYSFSLTWKPPSYMVHGLFSAHLEVTKGVGRHFLQGGCALGAPHLNLIRFPLSLESLNEPAFPFMLRSCYMELHPYKHACANILTHTSETASHQPLCCASFQRMKPHLPHVCVCLSSLCHREAIFASTVHT